MSYGELVIDIDGNYSKLFKKLDDAEARLKKMASGAYKVAVGGDSAAADKATAATNKLTEAQSRLKREVADATSRSVKGYKAASDAQSKITSDANARYRKEISDQTRFQEGQYKQRVDSRKRALKEEEKAAAESAAKQMQAARNALATTYRGNGTSASIIGGPRNINVDLIKAEQAALKKAEKEWDDYGKAVSAAIAKTRGANGGAAANTSWGNLPFIGKANAAAATIVASAKRVQQQLTRTQDDESKKRIAIENRESAVMLADAKKINQAVDMVRNSRYSGKLQSVLGDITSGNVGGKQAIEQVRGAMRGLADDSRKSVGWLEKVKLTVVSFGTSYLIIQGLRNAFSGLVDMTIHYNEVLQNARIGLTNLLGGNQALANNLITRLQQFAEVTPFNFKDLVPYVNQLKAVGFAYKDIMPTLKAAGEAAAGTGLGTEGVHRIIYALGQIKSAGRLALTEVRQLTEANIPAIKYLADAYGVSSEKILAAIHNKLIPAGDAIKAITAGINKSPILGGFAGSLEAQSRTFQGIMSNIQDALYRVFGEATQDAFEGLTKLGKGIQDFVSSDKFYVWARKAIDAFTGLAQKTADVFTWITDNGPAVRTALWGIGTAYAYIQLQATKAAIAQGLEAGAGGATAGLKGVAGLAAVFAGRAGASAAAGGIAGLGAAAVAAAPEIIAVGIALTGLYAIYDQFAEKAEKVNKATIAIVKNTRESNAALNEAIDFGGNDDKLTGSIAKIQMRLKEAGNDVSKMRDILKDINQARYEAKVSTKLGNSAKALIDADLGVAANNIIAKPYLVQVKMDEESKGFWQKFFEEARRDNWLPSSDTTNSIGKGIGGISDFFGRLNTNDPSIDAFNKNIKDIVTERNKAGAKAYEDITKAWFGRNAMGGPSKGSADLSVGGNFFKTPGIAARTPLIDTLRKEAEAERDAAGTKPTITGDDKKKTAAARKLENDRLSQAIKLYDSLAKAAEDSTKRQVDALTKVNDLFKDIFGTFQDSLAKYGILSSPIDGLILKFQKLLDVGGKASRAVVGGLTISQGYAQHAVHARMAKSSLNGGTGEDLAGEAKYSGIPAYLTKMVKDNGRDIGLQCGYAITNYFKKTGLGGTATSIARSGNARPQADGTYAPGTVFNFQGGKKGYRVNHYAMVGPDGKHWLESNWAAKNTVSNNREINWKRDINAATWGGRVNAGVPRGVSVSKALIGKGALGIQNGLDEANGDNGLSSALQNLFESQNLLKFAPLPKEFGKAIEESEAHVNRFRLQLLFADAANQKFLKTILGEAGYKKAAKDAGVLSDKMDATLNNARINLTLREMYKTEKARGTENNPLAQLRASFDKGGANEGASPAQRAALGWMTVKNVVRNTRDEVDKFIRSQKDSNLVQVRAAQLFNGSAESLKKYNRAIEIGNARLAFARSDNMVKLFNTDPAQFNQQLERYTQQFTRTYDFQQKSNLNIEIGTAKWERQLAVVQAIADRLGDMDEAVVQFNKDSFEYEKGRAGGVTGSVADLLKGAKSDYNSQRFSNMSPVENANQIANEKRAQIDLSISAAKASGLESDQIKELVAGLESALPSLDEYLRITKEISKEATARKLFSMNKELESYNLPSNQRDKFLRDAGIDADTSIEEKDKDRFKKIQDSIDSAREVAAAMQQVGDTLASGWASNMDKVLSSTGSVFDKIGGLAAGLVETVADYMRKLATQILTNYAVSWLLKATGLGGVIGGMQAQANQGVTIPGISGSPVGVPLPASAIGTRSMTSGAGSVTYITHTGNIMANDPIEYQKKIQQQSSKNTSYDSERTTAQYGADVVNLGNKNR